MYNQIDKEKIKNKLEDVLIYYGFKAPINGKENWTCLESRHTNPEKNLTVTGNLFCCHCGLQGDVFSLIAEMEGLSIKGEFRKILNKAIEILNIENNEIIFDTYTNYYKKNIPRRNKKKKDINYNLTTIIQETYRKRNKKRYIYYNKRGISNELIGKYMLLVEKPTNIFPSDIIPNLPNKWAYEYIIPIWENGEVVNCILRRNDWKNKENNKVLNLKNYELRIMNLDYLKQKNDYIFICESWADCLSFENEGYKAIAINSIVMYNQMFYSIKKNKENTKDTTFYICLDNAQYGRKFSSILNNKLNQNGFKSINLIHKKYKDVNEFYVKDKYLFIKKLKSIIRK